MPIFVLPLQRREPIGPEALAALAVELFGDRDPALLFSRSQPIRLRKDVAGTVLEIDLPNISEDEVDVAAAGRDLVVHVRDAQRLIALPDSLAGRSLVGVRLCDGVLEVAFAPSH